MRKCCESDICKFHMNLDFWNIVSIWLRHCRIVAVRITSSCKQQQDNKFSSKAVLNRIKINYVESLSKFSVIKDTSCIWVGFSFYNLMAATGIKFDDGSGGFASSCFPVRGLMRQTEDGKNEFKS